ncbi:hypothetical protein [Methylovorus glucosotrophus]|jgi:hypothetical protein|uniref:Uncharacterized protein n=1 Tax=Methylovorus glucosotrophus (strain SIP3-4) TaxID=582744 RepID=C6XA69_METGS|nr:hypothetical protein [Methylovorus glucosotrophus]ACT51610.1 conserved hypothetical protein [Methylovorus glucosotrophus SIP3-4]
MKINKIGKILNGKDKGYYVEIIHDGVENQNGPYLIVTSASLDFSIAYDDWVPDLQGLNQYLAEAGWVIDWDFE